MEGERLLDNTDGISFGSGAMRFADLTDHWDDADDSLETKEEEQKSEASFFRKSALGLFVYLAVGVVFYSCVSPLENTNPPLPGHNATAVVTWIDSLYFTMVTLTTVGYGDFHPKDGDIVSELFTCVFVLVGILFVSIGLSFFVSNILDKQENLIASVLDNDISPTAPGKCGLSQLDWKVVTAIATCFFFIVLGMIVFAFAENWSFTKALYYVCISITTVGYGDAHVMNPGTKIFACVWLGFSTLSLGKTVSELIDWKLSKKILSIRSRVLNKKFDTKLFQQMDHDNDGSISKFDFLVFQLVNGQWNVDQVDVDTIMQKFATLDKNKNQKLSMKELGILDVEGKKDSAM